VTTEAILVAGNSILGEVLRPAAFVLGPVESGNGSGGRYAIGRWTRESQFIELHVRWALGIVRYGWGGEVFDHRHVADAVGASVAYPGFSDDPIDGFRHLADDLRGPLAAVVAPDNREVLRLARAWTPPTRLLP
jgi:hypothetical protein